MFKGLLLFLFYLLMVIFGACLPPTSFAQTKYMNPRSVVNDGPTKPDFSFLSDKLLEADDYCWDNDLNTEVGIFIDLGLNSGYFRCWVIGYSDGIIRLQGLVAHGSGKANWLPTGTRRYSNDKGSLLSSLGKYKTGNSYKGEYGLAYKLFGMEASNSNAYSRAIVLHAHQDIPDVQSTKALFQSWGCPTVSRSFLKRLQPLIDNSDKPLLVWIFDSTQEKSK
jgi:hypothetical protein